MSEYDDIINLPHPTSKKHPRMSMENRAAQFSPFAALTGHGDAIKETARLTDERIALGESAIAELDMKIGRLAEIADEHPEVTVTYFKEDERKQGGEYVTITDKVKRIDDVARVILLTSGEKIEIRDVIEIEHRASGLE